MLRVDNLKTGYGDQVVVHLPNWQIGLGEKCLISGPSGSGKTTLLYALAGLGQIQQGRITVDETDLYALNETARDHFRGNRIGLVFQTLHLIKSLTVFDNILLGAFVNKRRQDQAWALHLLDRLGIADLKDRPVTEISQGQAQRVAIARALLNKPKLLLADEPTSALDDKSAERVVSLLSSLAAETNAALVVSSHDGRIRQAFDNVLVMGNR